MQLTPPMVAFMAPAEAIARLPPALLSTIIEAPARVTAKGELPKDAFGKEEPAHKLRAAVITLKGDHA